MPESGGSSGCGLSECCVGWVFEMLRKTGGETLHARVSDDDVVVTGIMVACLF